MSRAAQRARMDAYAKRELHAREWGIPLVTEQVADITDAEQFPETALALEHARRVKEARDAR